MPAPPSAATTPVVTPNVPTPKEPTEAEKKTARFDHGQLKALKKYIESFKPIEGEEKGQGFEGHSEWRDNDEMISAAQALFFHSVKKRMPEEVKSWLDILVPYGFDEHKIVALQQLLTNCSSEEALKEALLVSISTGSRPLVEFVLCLFVQCPYLERSGCANSDRFAPHITPLMLACILNNFAIVQCLLRRGHSIQTPHFSGCDCPTCRMETTSTHWDIRLVDVMRAISSEAYMWLATDDVFVMCCRVSDDLESLLGDRTSYNTKIFEQLSLNVKKFMARLSDQTWRANEFEKLTGHNNHCLRRTTELAYPRLEMAIDSNMTQFIASANAQTCMKSVFRYDWYNFGRDNLRDKWRLLRCTILMPFLVLLHALAPNQATTMAVPMARFYSHVATYLCFLAACFLRPYFGYMHGWDGHSNRYVFVIELCMYAYLIGLTIEKGILFYRIGPDTFFGYWWRIIDALFIISGVCSALLYFNTHLEREVFDPITIDRVHWPSTEMLLLYEISFAATCVFGIIKIFYYIQFSETLGGTVISVGKCILQVRLYVAIMLITMAGFAVGLSGLLGPYLHRKQLKPDGTVDVGTTQSYSTPPLATKNLFWTMFGYMGPSTYVTAVGNLGKDLQPTYHEANSFTIELLAIIFHILIIITLINLMTSLLVKKADEVLDNEDMEYKCTRSVMMSEFLSWETAAPPPWNLILVPLHWVHRNLFDRLLESPSWGEKPNEEDATESLYQREYLDLLVIMFYRFLGIKEVKYKSICRTEFNEHGDKEEIHQGNVQSLNAKMRPFPMDNTYKGFRHRDEAHMYRALYRKTKHKPIESEYEGKGTEKKMYLELKKEKLKKGYPPELLMQTILPGLGGEQAVPEAQETPETPAPIAPEAPKPPIPPKPKAKPLPNHPADLPPV